MALTSRIWSLKTAVFVCSFLCMSFTAGGVDTESNTINNERDTNNEGEPSLSVEEFQNILHTEVRGEIVAMYENLQDRMRNLRDTKGTEIPKPRHLWEHIVEHGWYMSETTIERQHDDDNVGLRSARYLQVEEQIPYPFVVCSRSPLLSSGYKRLQPMLKHTGALQEDSMVILNEDKQTCYHISAHSSKAKFIDTIMPNEEYVIVPLSDVMKIQGSTVDEITKDYWSVSSKTQIDEKNPDLTWERVIVVSFAPGLGPYDDEQALAKAEGILSAVKTMGKEGSRRRRRLSEEEETRSEQHEGSVVLSVTEAFSLTTSSVTSEPNSRRVEAVSTSRSEFWSRSLQNGLEAEHGCQAMFDNLTLRLKFQNEGFEIVLNPTDGSDITEDDDESSASNMDCVTSLIAALSVHPSVLHIEANRPIVAHDYESQWVSQSRIQDQRPLFDVGLDGNGQFVSVSDSGLNINHPNFVHPGGTNGAVYDRWMTSQRKVVRYDTDPNAGDRQDDHIYHGTMVSGIIVGKRSDGSNPEADGVARGAKLHMYDMGKGNSISAPSISYFLSSIDNGETNARISNNSWGASHGEYSSFCRSYDSALSNYNDDLLYIFSAGNSGNDGGPTIGDPAMCKNTLAVGASQSAGNRIGRKDFGHDYLCSFSSRGPTKDGRMKPDMVAPGYTLMTAGSGESYVSNMGTSFAAPVAAGNAALVRQYFEEKWFPCGSKGCSSKSITPSGSLLKATLMNGAQSLKSVQNVPAGDITESVSLYDNNQGMGVINMAATLPIKGKNNINAVAVNKKTIGDGGEHHIIVEATSCGTSSISATLAWYDLPGSYGCANCLLNDMDLSIQRINSSGSVYNTYYPNGLNNKDYKNTVERVQLDATPGQRYRINMKATNLSSSSQKYSLMATGCFQVISKHDDLVC